MSNPNQPMYPWMNTQRPMAPMAPQQQGYAMNPAFNNPSYGQQNVPQPPPMPNYNPAYRPPQQNFQPPQRPVQTPMLQRSTPQQTPVLQRGRVSDASTKPKKEPVVLAKKVVPVSTTLNHLSRQTPKPIEKEKTANELLYERIKKLEEQMNQAKETPSVPETRLEPKEQAVQTEVLPAESEPVPESSQEQVTQSALAHIEEVLSLVITRMSGLGDALNALEERMARLAGPEEFHGETEGSKNTSIPLDGLEWTVDTANERLILTCPLEKQLVLQHVEEEHCDGEGEDAVCALPQFKTYHLSLETIKEE